MHGGSFSVSQQPALSAWWKWRKLSSTLSWTALAPATLCCPQHFVWHAGLGHLWGCVYFLSIPYQAGKDSVIWLANFLLGKAKMVNEKPQKVACRGQLWWHPPTLAPSGLGACLIWIWTLHLGTKYELFLCCTGPLKDPVQGGRQTAGYIYVTPWGARGLDLSFQ